MLTCCCLVLGKMAMSAAQKNSLVKNRVHLVNNVTPTAAFLAHLRQGYHISDSMEEEIMVCAQIVETAILVVGWQFC